MKLKKTCLGMGLVFWACTVWAHGHDARVPAPQAVNGQLVAQKCWVRLMPGRTPAAAYLELENHGQQTVRLAGASSSAYARVMVHQSGEKNGMSHMSHAQDIAVPAGGRLLLQPGGYHVMLEKPVSSLSVGGQIVLSLHLSDGTQVATQCELREPKTQAF
ncbi:MAG TPA: copper chaperone PCu(A)C [Alcaligenes sp.]|nr:copper chaperone PCu(A)C [Alcaligenes sp.]HRL26846.1 copper chaperone PCu(A)C [Alcaligenes sp.]